MKQINDILSEEEEKHLNKKDELLSAIAQLPKGSLFIRTRNDKRYCYLVYREQGKIISQYVGTAEKENEIREQIELRKKLETQLKGIYKELKRIHKMKLVK